MATRREQFDKYRTSDIFNLNSNNSNNKSTIIQTSKRGPLQRTLEKTKSDIFNSGVPKGPNMHSQTKRDAKFSKYYQSNIFNTSKPEIKNKSFISNKKLNNTSTSSCFDFMKNNKQYVNELKDYTNKHRPLMEQYNPDKYYGNDNAAERYFTEMYGKNIIQNKDKKTINAELNKKKKLFSERKIAYKKQFAKRPINIINNKKDFRKKIVNLDENISNGHKFVESQDNKLNTAKINYYLNLESHIFKDNENKQKNNNLTLDTKIYYNIKTEDNKNNNNEINNDKKNIGTENKEPINNEEEKHINEEKTKDKINDNLPKDNDNIQKSEDKNIKLEEKTNDIGLNIYKKRLINIKNSNKKDKTKKNINIQRYKDYNEHNFTLSYGTKKNDFDKFNEKDIKDIFAKRGVHVYDVKKSHFDQGIFNTIEFRVRENEGNENLKHKIKSVQNDLFKKKYIVSIKEKNIQVKKRNDLEKILRDEHKEKNEKNEKNVKNEKNEKNENNGNKKPKVYARKPQLGNRSQINYKYKNNYL